jgi:hypothetical protein
MSDLKFKFLVWLCPGLVMEVDRLRHKQEAMNDILMTGIPFTEEWCETAYQNVVAMEPDYFAGHVSIQDRQSSLIEIYRRSQ